MHTSVLVIGENYQEQLAAFNMDLEVKPYLKTCFCNDIDGQLSTKQPEQDCEDCNGTGTYLSKDNPLGMYDWYVLGGRWKGFFTVYPGKPVTIGKNFWDKEPLPANQGDQARKGDIDWQKMQRNAAKRASLWWDEGYKSSHPYLYNIHPGETRKQYIERESSRLMLSRAIVKNGHWYPTDTDEIRTKQWETQWKEIIMSLPDATLLSLVDIHY